MNIEDLQAAILNAIQRRDELVSEAREKYIAAAKAEHAYRQKFAKAMLQNADGKNAEVRKAQAEIAVDVEMFQYKLQQAEADGLTQAIRAKADEISALQSLLRVERDEIAAIQYGQRTGA